MHGGAYGVIFGEFEPPLTIQKVFNDGMTRYVHCYLDESGFFAGLLGVWGSHSTVVLQEPEADSCVVFWQASRGH